MEKEKVIKASVLFDQEWYINQYEEVKESGIDPAVHYLTIGWKKGYWPGPQFDGNNYLDLNQDVKKVNMNPLLHYELYGRKEKRIGGYFSIKNSLIIKVSVLFDQEWYINQYEEVKESGIDPAVHYLTIGWKKGYWPGPQFDGNNYLDLNQDVKKANMNPLLHYELYGRKEKRIGGYFSIKNSLIIKTYLNFLMRKLFQIIYLKKIRNNKDSRILVCLHLFYYEQWPNIKEYIKNLKGYTYDLIVTHVSYLPKFIEEEIRSLTKNVTFFKVENRGFDIGAFIYSLKNINLDYYDFILKLQTKRNVGKNNYYGIILKGKEWRNLMYDAVLGYRNVHKAIDKLKRKEASMVCNKSLITHNDSLYNKNKVYTVMNQLKIHIPEKYLFSMGSIFLIRSDQLKDLVNKVNYGDFEESTRGIFTYAHIIERVICLDCLNKYGIIGIRTFNPAIYIRNKLIKKRNLSVDNTFINNMVVNDNLIFYRYINAGSRKVYTASSILKYTNKALFSNLIKSEFIEVDKSSHLYQILLKDLVQGYEIARINSSFEKTIFRLVGGTIIVEKKVIKKYYLPFFRIDNVTPTPLLSGIDFINILKPLQNNKDNILDRLIPYLKYIFEEFKVSDVNKISGKAWDAIPRNIIIDSNGRFMVFDINIKHLFNIYKNYFIYRVICTLKFDINLSAEYELEIYILLCKYFGIKNEFEKNRDLENFYMKILAKRV